MIVIERIKLNGRYEWESTDNETSVATRVRSIELLAGRGSHSLQNQNDNDDDDGNHEEDHHADHDPRPTNAA